MIPLLDGKIVPLLILDNFRPVNHSLEVVEPALEVSKYTMFLFCPL